MASRLPPLLEPYLRLPPETSLILLTGVLGSTTNWLVQRYLYSLLLAPSAVVPADENFSQADTGGTNVILLSFLRDYTFWKEGVGRLGVDLDAAAAKKGKLVYVDGLDALFEPSHARDPKPTSRPGRRVLSAPTVNGLRKELEQAISHLKANSTNSGPKTVLIIDQPDLLLAAAGHDLSSHALYEMLLDIREVSGSIGSRDQPCQINVLHFINSFTIERVFDHCHTICRRALDIITINTAGERACGIYSFYGT